MQSGCVGEEKAEEFEAEGNSDVWQQLERAVTTVSIVAEMTCTLEQRLGAILSEPTPCDETKKEVKESARTQLGDRILQVWSSAKSAERRLQDIFNRLEI